MRLGKIIDTRFYAALNKLTTEPLPLRVAFKLKGISKAAREEFGKYEEVRHAALEKYATKGEDGKLKVDEQQNAIFDEAGMNGFLKELADLSSMDVPMPTIKLSELGENIKVTVADLDILDDVVIAD